jgi:hypothetical protein
VQVLGFVSGVGDVSTVLGYDAASYSRRVDASSLTYACSSSGTGFVVAGKACGFIPCPC